MELSKHQKEEIVRSGVAEPLLSFYGDIFRFEKEVLRSQDGPFKVLDYGLRVKQSGEANDDAEIIFEKTTYEYDPRSEEMFRLGEGKRDLVEASSGVGLKRLEIVKHC